jgi:hypothetical protein
MSRTVATARNSTSIVYLPVSFDETEQVYSICDWQELIEDVRDCIQEKYSSFHECDRWDSNEVHVILENRFAYVTISEYCGLVSVCLVPKDNEPLAESWCYNINQRWSLRLNKRFGGLRKIGTASNGEAFFERIEIMPKLNIKC